MSPLLHSAAVTGRPELAYQSMSQQVNETPSWDGIKLLALHPLLVDSSLVDSLPVDPLTFNQPTPRRPSAVALAGAFSQWPPFSIKRPSAYSSCSASFSSLHL